MHIIKALETEICLAEIGLVFFVGWSRSTFLSFISFKIYTDEDIKEGEYVVAETFQIVDPDTHTSVYNDMWLKEYTTALIKQQWGANLIKFEGMQLPGGVILNGRQIYDDATTDIDKLRETIRLEHEMPPDFFIG